MTATAPSADFLERLDQILVAHQGREGPLLPILHDIQAEWGYVPEEAQPVIAEALGLTRAEVHGVVSFYHDFTATPDPRPSAPTSSRARMRRPSDSTASTPLSAA